MALTASRAFCHFDICFTDAFEPVLKPSSCILRCHVSCRSRIGGQRGDAGGRGLKNKTNAALLKVCTLMYHLMMCAAAAV